MFSAEEAIEQLREATKNVAAQTSGLREAREERERERVLNSKAAAAARRRGDSGNEWQVLQQRIDLGQTTEFDIVQGFDLSPEARAVRKQMGEDIGKIADERAKEVGEGAELPPEFAEAQAQIAATVARLRDLAP